MTASLNQKNLALKLMVIMAGFALLFMFPVMTGALKSKPAHKGPRPATTTASPQLAQIFPVEQIFSR